MAVKAVKHAVCGGSLKTDERRGENGEEIKLIGRHCYVAARLRKMEDFQDVLVKQAE